MLQIIQTWFIFYESTLFFQFSNFKKEVEFAFMALIIN